MKYLATIRVDVEASTLEARDFLLKTLAADITKSKPIVRSIGAGGAQVTKATVSRARPKPRGKKK